MAKRSMASLLPKYDASRMLGEYVTKYYLPAARQGRRYGENGFDAAKQVATWKSRVRSAWPGVALRRVDTPARRIQFGETVPVEVAAKLNGLAPSDVCVELIVTRTLREAAPVSHSYELTPAGESRDGEHRFRIDLKPTLAGRLDYRMRVYPRNELLTHPHELGLATWL
jgi:starch phosphorylase